MSTELDVIHKGELALTGGDLSTNPAAVYLAGLRSARSRRVMGTDLGRVACMLTGEERNGTAELLGAALAYPWHELRKPTVTLILSQLTMPKADGGKGYTAATANRVLSAVRGALKAAWEQDRIDTKDYQRAISVKNTRGKPLPAGRALDPGEVAALMAACAADPTPAGARDAALVAVGYSCGLRRAELVALTLADYDPATGALTVEHGKGDKARTVYAKNGAADALADWLVIRGEEPGALFVPVHKGGAITIRPMTAQAFYGALRKRGIQAGIADFSPHDLRRTFASDLLDKGADISTVAALMGHASVTTTQRYDRRPERTKEAASSLLFVPYRKRTS